MTLKTAGAAEEEGAHMKWGVVKKTKDAAVVVVVIVVADN
jgi:hypothetical protein